MAGRRCATWWPTTWAQPGWRWTVPGDVVGRFDYAPYGEIAAVGSAPDDVRYRYTGHPEDALLGSYNTPRRAYDQALGRFLEVDPKRTDVSPYVYASGNPIGRVDLTGGEDVHFIFIDYAGFGDVPREQLHAALRSWYRMPADARVEFRDMRDLSAGISTEEARTRRLARRDEHLTSQALDQPLRTLWGGAEARVVAEPLRLVIGPNTQEVPELLTASLVFLDAYQRVKMRGDSGLIRNVSLDGFTDNEALISAFGQELSGIRRIEAVQLSHLPYSHLGRHMDQYRRDIPADNGRLQGEGGEQPSGSLREMVGAGPGADTVPHRAPGNRPLFRGRPARPQYQDYYQNYRAHQERESSRLLGPEEGFFE